MTAPARRRLIAAAARDVAALHAEWREAKGQYEIRMEAQFREAKRRLHLPAGRLPRGTPSAQDAEAILDLVAPVRVKPRKGRAKDLRAVERLLAGILERLPPQE
ncbi:MAG: hypothetical protein ACYDBQ_01880 [Thermoplasmatota archaeon]